MKKRLTALCAYALFWLLFFIVARLFFIFTQHKEAFIYSPGILAATFTNGIKLDLSATGYIFIIPVMLIIPGVLLNGEWFRKFMKWYTWLLVLVASVIVVADTVLYKYWGFRMDHTPLLYLKTPGEAAASVSTLTILLVVLAIAIITLLFIALYRRFVDSLFSNFDRIRLWPAAMFFFLLLWGSLLIPIRGGVGIAPINAGTVYFNENMFINHTAINVVWNVGSSMANAKPSHNPYRFYDTDSAKALRDNLTMMEGLPEKVINIDRPNILFIILESFGNLLVGPLGGDSLTTPRLNTLAGEGLLFTNFYASGNRTDKALPAILNAYPAQPAVSIIKEPKKSQSLNGIVRTLTGLGYRSSFWYGGEINFANFNSFVLSSGFQQVVTMHNFNPVHYNSKWGVHDHILFEVLMDSMRTMKEPFLKVVLTLSSHEPFEVPMDPVFIGRDDLTKFRNSVYYTDRSVGGFIDWAKGTDWWQNTLVILVADHYRRSSTDIHVYSEEIFKIPMLWLGGALTKQGGTIEKYGSQVDITPTVLNQIGLPDYYPFAKDLLNTSSNSFAFYTFNEGFGFITDSSALIYDHILGKPVVSRGSGTEAAEKYGRAYLQVLYDDFLAR